MEYTESMGDMYMTYNGTPEEIFRLISLKDNEEIQALEGDKVINHVYNIAKAGFMIDDIQHLLNELKCCKL